MTPSRSTFSTGFSTGWRVCSLRMREHRLQRLPLGVRLRPAGQFLGHAVQERHPPLRVRGDHRIADAGERHPQPLPLLVQPLLGRPSARSPRRSRRRPTPSPRASPRTAAGGRTSPSRPPAGRPRRAGSRRRRPCPPAAAHSWSLTRGSPTTALVRCGFRSWAIRPILYLPTGTRLCGPSRCVYSPALARSSRTSSGGFSVQMRANAPCRWSTSASGTPLEHRPQAVALNERRPDRRIQGEQPHPLVQRRLGSLPLADVPEDQHAADDVALGVPDRGGAVVNRPLRPVLGDQDGVVRQPDDLAVLAAPAAPGSRPAGGCPR